MNSVTGKEERGNGDDAGVELLISRLLRLGVLASLFLIVTGSALRLSHEAGDAAALRRLIDAGASFRFTLSGLWAGLLNMEGDSLVVAGLLLLILTPVLRGVVAAVSYARARDRAFALIASAVFLLMLLSFALGEAG